MKCLKCGIINAKGVNFCGNCGSSLIPQPPKPLEQRIKFCPGCGHPISAGNDFCPSCGRQLSNLNIPAEPATSVPNHSPLKTLTSVEKHIGDVSVGRAEATGNLIIFDDHISFEITNGNAVGKAIKFVGKAFSKKKNDSDNNPEVYSYSAIGGCFFSKYMSTMPSVLLAMKDGSMIKFAKLNKSNDVKEAIALINSRITPTVGIPSEQAPAPTPDSAADPYAAYRFVMEVTNFITVDEQYIAIVGTVRKGTAEPGDTLSVNDKNGNKKGSVEIKSIAVNQEIASSAQEGDDETAFLCSFPHSLLKSGDIICS